ncbi:uncharacterized protein N7496_002496 [Penicillium cataractarum]|uniref:Uncharacterized protein n=1 Tax=Penicillium cataractarum TaxID=2100454 RepID=A0A9W9SPE7_9EURO|nr:uncharacterized protein N7496_002496 [Penicillium cataractarum]KAJ5380068.1 hypothetical protein N7496_002496 [Penicillium cataractarum]
MPVYQIHTPFARPIFPISFPTFLSIVLVLGYLQFLYGISFILHPVWPLRFGSRPFKKTIQDAEKQALDIIVGIIPPPVYRSPVPSSAFANEETTFHRYPGPHRSLYVSYENARTTLPRVVELDDFPQGYHSNGRPHSSHNLHLENQMPDSGAKHIGPSPLAGMHDHSGSQYDGAGNSVPSTDGQSNAVPTKPIQHVVFVQSASPKQSREQRKEEHSVIDVVHGITIDSLEVSPVEANPVEIEPVEAKPVEAKPVKVTPINTTEPSINSSPTSSEDPKVSIDVTPPSSSHYTDESIALSLPNNRTAKCHSTESYPGKFPVSEGLDYSSLATASSNFREKGTTHVRPFSDY